MRANVASWRKQLLDGASEIFDGPAAKAAKESEPSSAVLYEQIGRLKVELEWLKKSCPGPELSSWSGLTGSPGH
jgi:putative transposase